MNNRYLYKAKKKNWRELPTEEQWVVGYIVHRPTGEWEILRKCDNPPDGDPMWQKVLITYEIDPTTICQCTGLKDKNGKLIWENDVVRCIDKNNDLEFIAVIEFGNSNAFYSWGYQLRHIKGDKPNLNILLWIDMEDTGASCEIISNTFDNPELLEVAE